ncbi:Thiol:disulfide interchange protein DsbD [termite gut metagenome]|uniref:Thiol:disulfide interchange protein DsbD n=1 Tax=termite gut metagenome TaxID=433724 RepID=A0A5J4SUE8_9ZZZZ
MKKLFNLFLLVFFLFISKVNAQIYEPVKFQTQLKTLSTNEAEIIFTATIDAGWHIYSTDLTGGPIPATFHTEKIEGVELLDKLTPRGNEISKFDKFFGINVRYFERNTQFVQKIKITKIPYHIEGYLEYGVCNNETCLPPMQVSVYFSEKEKTIPVKKNDNFQQSDTKDYWIPVINELKKFGETPSQKDNTWIYILLTGFAGGLLALFTPCVLPIIPMTVSFFLKRSDNKKKAIRDAIIYGISIIIIYLTLGLLVTLIFGANALNTLSTNAIFNIIFFLILILFAASFLGAFEITLPSRWSNAADRKAGVANGWISIFLMAFTLTLVSFSCTGPIIGFLLVEVSTTGGLLAPAIGMFGFAVALALPFTLFALFPSWLKSVPKSGGWMNTIKVTLGFIEIAFALKFLSVADLTYGWGILDRETFLALWIVLFALLGFYFLGKIRFPHDDENNKINLPRFFLALITLAFTVYLIPGLWGAPLKTISAFAPPLKTQDFNLYTYEVHPKFDDYDAGMDYARKVGKPAMLDFTGYGCVNCRKMELAVWTDPRVSHIINNDYVLITLYVDNRQPLTQPINIIENDTPRTLRTTGDKWSYLQRVKFGANAQPFYILIDNEGYPLNKPYAYKEDIDTYVNFLQTGLANYRK